MKALNAKIFLSKFKDDLQKLIEQFNFKPHQPCDIMPWLVIDEYLSGKFPNGFFKPELHQLTERLGKFDNIISVLKDFKSDFSDDISEISLSSTDYVHSYESFIIPALEYEIEKKQKGKDWIIDREDFLNNNQYLKLYEICRSVKTTIKSSKGEIKGFTCNLHPETVKEIYIFMADKDYLSGDLNDFQAIFSKVSISVEYPVKWQILNERGTKTGRGNQTSIFVFLKLMLGTISNADLKKCKDLFIDEKGKFIEKDLLRPDKDKILTFGFENQIKEILKKADQQKNQ
jgi:hypothetical protein